MTRGSTVKAKIGQKFYYVILIGIFSGKSRMTGEMKGGAGQ